MVDNEAYPDPLPSAHNTLQARNMKPAKQICGMTLTGTAAHLGILQCLSHLSLAPPHSLGESRLHCIRAFSAGPCRSELH
jgi:hypothetical protein